MPWMADSDAAQVALVLGGDPDAFRVLVDRHSRRLFRLAYRMTGNEHDAEEVVQDAFLRAYRRLEQFESRANFGTWLYRICANCALDQMRKHRGESLRAEPPAPEDSEAMDPLDTTPSPEPSPERLALSGEMSTQVQAAMDSLSAMERMAFVLRHVEGFSIEEIAESLGLNLGATKNSIFRAVQKLRRHLAPLVSEAH
jgi:RNA polymerase sigma-70 factor (ECF subfamily)